MTKIVGTILVRCCRILSPTTFPLSVCFHKTGIPYGRPLRWPRQSNFCWAAPPRTDEQPWGGGARLPLFGPQAPAVALFPFP